MNLSRLVCLLQCARGWRRLALAALAGAVSALAMAPIFAWPVLFLTFPLLVWWMDAIWADGSKAPDAALPAKTPPPGVKADLGRPCDNPGTRKGTQRSEIWQGSIRSSAALGWAFGFGYFLAGLYWVGAAFLVEAERFAWALPFAVMALPAGLALFYAGATALAGLFWRTAGAMRILALATAFVAAEWLRGHVLTGFPWNTLGYALTWPDTMMQNAALFGVYGLTFWAVLIFAAPALLAKPAPARRRAWGMGIALPLVALAALAAHGWARLAAAGPARLTETRLRIVQPNIPQRDKWRPHYATRIFERYLTLSRTGKTGSRTGGTGGTGGTGAPHTGGTGLHGPLAGVSALIWPESSLPFLLLRTRKALAAIDTLLPAGTHLLTGALRAMPAPSPNARRPAILFNSLLVLGPGARLEAVYDKAHLVPFGEYLPLQGTLEAIGLEQLTRIKGGFAAGRARKRLEIAGLPPFVPLICYEIIFPGAALADAPRPAWLLNVTNDAWFGETSGPYQHLHQARVRAVEEGLPVVRAANTGVSALIDPMGRILARLELGRAGIIDARLPSPLPPPIYARYGDTMTLVLFLAGLSGCFFSAFRVRAT